MVASRVSVGGGGRIVKGRDGGGLAGCEFAYADKVASAGDGLWSERYPPELALYARLMTDRNERVCDLAAGGERLLDLGCGMGDLLDALAERYSSVVGIDPSHEMVAHATRVLDLRGVKAEIQQGCAEAIDLADESIDTVLMLDVYEHIRPSMRSVALAEVFRVLKPGGELLLVTPSRAVLRMWNLIDNLLLIPMRLWRREKCSVWAFVDKPHTEVFVSRREVVRSVSDVGLYVDGFERVGFFPAPERAGVWGPLLRVAYRVPFMWRAVEAMFVVARAVPLLRQKMLFRCVKVLARACDVRNERQGV